VMNFTPMLVKFDTIAGVVTPRSYICWSGTPLMIDLVFRSKPVRMLLRSRIAG